MGANLKSNEPKTLADPLFDFSKVKDRNLAIEFVRVVILVILLTFTIVLQSVQDYFVNIELLFPALIALFISYFLHAIYVFSLHTKKQRKWLQWFFFFFDTTILSYLIYLTSIYQSFFLLLYFVHIALARIVFSRRGAVTLAS